MGAAEVRAGLRRFLVRDLIGPASGEREVLEDSPKIRYAAGILFPRESAQNESEAVGGVEGSAEAREDAEPIEPGDQSEGQTVPRMRQVAPESDNDDTVTLANTYRPSAMGLSFMVEPNGSSLVVIPRAARYTSRQEKPPGREYPVTKWERQPLDLAPIAVNLEVGAPSKRDWEISHGLYLHGVFRPKPSGRYLVTFSLCNKTVEHSREAETFYQVGFDVRGSNDQRPFVEYRALEGAPEDDEERALAMLYRKRRAFAVGHGCAADWDPSDSDRTTGVATTVLPCVTVPPVNPVSKECPYLSMGFLRGDSGDPERDIPDALEELCKEYERWIGECEEQVGSLDERFRASAERHVALCRVALARMRGGVPPAVES